MNASHCDCPMEREEEQVGITTTVPVEVVLASGRSPVDLNNRFVSSPVRDELLETALSEGFPQNTCAWIKGMFGAVVGEGGPKTVVGVVRGDCSGTEVLLEALQLRGVEVIPFSYPYPADEEDLRREIERFCGRLGTSIGEAQALVERLAGARALLAELDRLCWDENLVSGLEAHLWLVSSSDFNGDPSSFERELGVFLDSAMGREPLDRRAGIPFKREVRLGYVGVPPINPDIFEMVEGLGARFVFHEVQRQFSIPMIRGKIEEIYSRYTYPYSLSGRAEDINREVRRRGIDGLVHYVQSFCHRNLEDVVLAAELDSTMLTVECDCPGDISAPSRSRLENFIQVLGENL